MDTGRFIVTAFDYFSGAFIVLIFIRIILSWIPTARNAITQFVWDVTEPILKPLRAVNPKGSPIDFSPMIVIIGLEILRNIIHQVL